MAAVATTLAVAAVGIGWFFVQQGGDADSSPAVPASTPTAAAIELVPGETVGSHLTPSLVATAPKQWAVANDGAYVNLGSDDGMFIEIDGPLLQVFDPKTSSGTDIPPDGFANWLRDHPWLTVLDDREVLIDGERFPQLTVKVVKGFYKPELGSVVSLGRSADMAESGRWPQIAEGRVLTQTVLEVDGETMVVSAYGAEDDEQRAELDAAQHMVLSTMELPD
ncbi:MAG TPA: hypothetical protein VFX15_09305 [Actinomycetes bacterium]|nr:hypothetical protein [Actinomycetes bacterium]